MTHERRVEQVYSFGPGIGSYRPGRLEQSNREYLSLGYWRNGAVRYGEAARQLLDYVLDRSGIVSARRILDVACGYGAEAFALLDRFAPGSIDALDLTTRHIDYASQKARCLGVGEKLRFHRVNACQLPFCSESFSHMLAIEGPAQFNTRQGFFGEAYRVLEPRGELVLADVILGGHAENASAAEGKLLSAAARSWMVPSENCVTGASYIRQLQRAGFAVLSFESLGDCVLPGYASNALNRTTFRARRNQRGFCAALGLTVISYGLGILYRRGMIDYILVKAKKKA